MKHKKELEARLAALEAAEPCKEHGRQRLEICMEPGCKEVRCMGCDQPCQCANDE